MGGYKYFVPTALPVLSAAEVLEVSLWNVIYVT